MNPKKILPKTLIKEELNPYTQQCIVVDMRHETQAEIFMSRWSFYKKGSKLNSRAVAT